MIERGIRVTVNGRVHEKTVEVRKTLADFLREDLDLTGTHLGCEHGAAVRSCLLRECPNLSEAQIRETISGNLCRCTGHASIGAAALAATEPTRRRGR